MGYDVDSFGRGSIQPTKPPHSQSLLGLLPIRGTFSLPRVDERSSPGTTLPYLISLPRLTPDAGRCVGPTSVHSVFQTVEV